MPWNIGHCQLIQGFIIWKVENFPDTEMGKDK